MGVGVPEQETISHKSRRNCSPDALVVGRICYQHAISNLARSTIIGGPLFAFFMGLHQLKGGWDDGAVTAAFARTFADTGRFALTPVSGQVEGFSSLTWMLLLTLPHYWSHSPDAILIWMKLLSAIALLFSLLIFRRIAIRLMTTIEHANTACLLFSLVAAPVIETLNGMEMNLYMLLALLLVDVLTNPAQKRRTFSISAIIFVLVATRFESPFVIVAVIAGLMFSRDRRSIAQVSLSGGISFSALELWRFHEFGVWMPNTVYAKMSAPYSPPHVLIPMLQARLLTFREVLEVFGGPIIALALIGASMYVLRRLPLPETIRPSHVSLSLLVFGGFLLVFQSGVPKITREMSSPGDELVKLGSAVLLVAVIALAACFRKQASTLERLTAALAAAGFLFGALAGRNWGYPGRMILPCIPFIVLALARFLEGIMPSEYWRGSTMCGCILIQAFVFFPAVRNAWRTGELAPVSAIQKTGSAVDAVRQLSGLNSLSVFLSDVGATSLFYDHLDILDSALLTNAYLTHHGYAASEQYLEARRPQVIESHGNWSALTRVYRGKAIEDYSLAIVDRTLLMLRNDIFSQVYARLDITGAAHTKFGSDCVTGIDPNYSFEDMAFFNTQKSCLYISRDDLLLNGVLLH